MKIELELDSEQLGILLTGIEGSFRAEHEEAEFRTEKAIQRELAEAVKNWRPDDGGEFEYEVLKMIPVYRQLLKYCEGNEPEGVLLAEDAETFVTALLVARGEGT